MNRRQFFAASAGVLPVVAGCSISSVEDPWKSAGNKPKILTSFAPLYCFAAKVAGEDAAVKCLLTTRGPHFHNDATVTDLELARGCTAFVINGIGLDEGLADKLGSNCGNPSWQVANLGASIKEHHLREGACHHDHGAGEEHDHGHDPHVWLGAKHAQTMTQAMIDFMVKIDPSREQGYRSRGASFIQELQQLALTGKERLSKCKDRRLISFHDSLVYFGDTYGVDIVDSIELEAGHEPSAPRINALARKCRLANVRLIAVEPQFPSHTSARLLLQELRKQNVDAQFVEVDPMETCAENDLTADYYVRRITMNIDNLVAAMS
ncbi:MAG: metal ABC transporter substrate-binding protein [Zavarzinella sp.]